MLRISTQTLFNRGLNGMLKQQADMGYTQEQIASGKKVLSPSDDPVGSVRILELNRSIETVKQYQKNAERAQSRLEVEEVALRSSADALQKVRELALQGSSDTYSPEQRKLLAIEIREMQSHILSQANAKDGNGDYLFSGFKGREKPFTLGGGAYSYHGDMGRRELKISSDRTLVDRDNGFDVFMSVPTAAAGAEQNIFATIEQIAADLEIPTSPASRLDDLDRAFEHITQMLASVGGRLNSIDTQNVVNEDFITTMEINRSTIEDLDYAEAITRFNRQQIALEAAQKSFAQIQGLSLFNYIN